MTSVTIVWTSLSSLVIKGLPALLLGERAEHTPRAEDKVTKPRARQCGSCGWDDMALYFRAILLDGAFDLGSDDEPVGDVPARRLRRPDDLDDLPPLETVVSGHRIASLRGQFKRKIVGLN